MSSASWEDVVNDGDSDDEKCYTGSLPRHLQCSLGSLTLDDDYPYLTATERCIKEGRHRRTRSLNSHLHALLPSHINAVVKSEPTLDAYERYLAQREFDLAEDVLNGLIGKMEDKKEQSKLYRSAAEATKRHFMFAKASEFFAEAEKLDPELPQSYLDHAKLLDEIGKAEEAEAVLMTALEKTGMSELVTVKLLKQLEKRGKLKDAKRVLGSIYKSNRLEKKNGQSLLEGVLFEARNGNVERALRLFRYLDKSCTVKSGFYVDLVELLRRRCCWKWAEKYGNEGVERFPTLPNNWNELLLMQRTLPDLLHVLKRAGERLSPTAMTKLTMNAVLLAARMGSVKVCRRLLSEKIVSAGRDQVWRYYVNATLVEILFVDGSMAPLLISYAKAAAPTKYMPTVIMVEAKVCEALSDVARAEDLYIELVNRYSCDWRIYLEYAMFLIRTNQKSRALQCVISGLERHPNTGRLWALRVQLEEGEDQIAALKTAINCAPKSGEVWTEAARVSMNPLSSYFNLGRVEFFLKVAFLFTPQYIDVFIERIRYELLTNGFDANLDEIRNAYFCGDGNYGTVIYMFRQPGIEFTAEEFDTIVEGVKLDLRQNWTLYSRAIARSSFVVGSVRSEEERLKIDQSSGTPFQFAFGLTSFHKAGLDPEDSKLRSSVIMGSSGVFV